MSDQTIYITQFDMDRLMDLIESIRACTKKVNKNIEKLEHELLRANLVDQKKVSKDIITMNSTVMVTDVDSGEQNTYTLVFPSEADIAQNKLSILAPRGMALLGYSRGDIVVWDVPGGNMKLRIDNILYQPEAAGRYDL